MALGGNCPKLGLSLVGTIWLGIFRLGILPFGNCSLSNCPDGSFPVTEACSAKPITTLGKSDHDMIIMPPTYSPWSITNKKREYVVRRISKELLFEVTTPCYKIKYTVMYRPAICTLYTTLPDTIQLDCCVADNCVRVS